VTSTTASEIEVRQIVDAEHHDPFHVLGAHPVAGQNGPAVAVRAFLPEAATAAVLTDFEEPRSMNRVHPAGFFEAVFENRDEVFQYRLRLTNGEGHTWTIVDPYSFWPVLTDFDVHLFSEGTHLRTYDKLGAHATEIGGVPGVLFAVWAPNAARVSVAGDFNSWDGRRHPMRSRPPSGLWELFIPGLGAGEKYKYEVRSRAGGNVVQKADPFAFCSELRPRTASVVCDIDHYQWGDGDWIANRQQHNGFDKPISIYEVHLGSWRRHPDKDNSWLNYRELAEGLVEYAQDMGFTHLELLPVSEHPLDASWGYQTTGYFSVTSRFGTPADFQYFIDYCHQNGIGVLLDWVPAHFPMDDHGLRRFDGTCLYEHEDPRLGEHQDWGTLIFNFGRTEVRNFLVANALFWFDKYHIDGLRVDAVASMLYLDYSRKEGEWIPNRFGGRENLEAIAFVKDLNTLVHGTYPGVLTIAEESTAWPSVSHPVHLGGLGFSLKWNMGWMHDTLVYFSKDPIHRKYHHNNLTFAVMYAFSENFILVLSHDEVVHMKGSMIRKMPGDDWQRFANLRALYGLMYAFPGKKLLFMGGEFGQWAEWDHDRSLDWHLLQYEPHRKLQDCVRDLNRLYRDLPQLHARDFHHSGFEWIDLADADQSIISFERRDKNTEESVMVAANLTPVPRIGYRIGLHRGGTFEVIFNSDSAHYGGSNFGNWGIVTADESGYQGRQACLTLDLPPLAVLYLRRRISGNP